MAPDKIVIPIGEDRAEVRDSSGKLLYFQVTFRLYLYNELITALEGINKTEDAEFEIVEQKQITYGRRSNEGADSHP